MKRSGKDLKRLSELTVLKVLSISRDGINWSSLLNQSGLSESTLSSCLKSLLRRGLVERMVDSKVYPPAVYYRLTERGFDELNSMAEVEEEALETEPTLEVSASLEDHVYSWFRLRGVALDVGRGGVSLKRLFLTFGLLPALEVAKAFKPTPEGEQYLRFLAKVYVKSIDPKALADMPVERQFEVVKFFWEMCSPASITKCSIPLAPSEWTLS